MHQIIIPKSINFFYRNNNNILIFRHKKIYKFFKSNLKLLINKKKNSLLITKTLTLNVSNNYKKQIKAIMGLVFKKIKQLIFELTTTYYQKLKFVGIGYKAIKVNFVIEKNVYLLKLGLSHPLYLSLNKKTDAKLICLKFTKLFVFGKSYKEISQIAANIRGQKKPDPYKGKGILLDKEKIKLKKGKKI